MVMSENTLYLHQYKLKEQNLPRIIAKCGRICKMKKDFKLLINTYLTQQL
jgi:hypothetical protein